MNGCSSVPIYDGPQIIHGERLAHSSCQSPAVKNGGDFLIGRSASVSPFTTQPAYLSQCNGRHFSVQTYKLAQLFEVMSGHRYSIDNIIYFTLSCRIHFGYPHPEQYSSLSLIISLHSGHCINDSFTPHFIQSDPWLLIRSPQDGQSLISIHSLLFLFLRYYGSYYKTES